MHWVTTYDILSIYSEKRKNKNSAHVAVLGESHKLTFTQVDKKKTNLRFVEDAPVFTA